MSTLYTPQQILPVLMGQALEETWHFEWLDQYGQPQGDISPYVEAAEVDHDSTQDVKRTFTMTSKGGIPVNFSTDFVKASHRIKMPAGDWVDFPLGVFTFAMPAQTIQPARTTYDASGQEPLFLLTEDSFLDTYSLAPGTPIVPAILLIIATSIFPFGIQIIDLGQTLASPLTWVAGDSKLKAVNDLLNAMAYETAWCDHDGVMRARPLPDYTTLAPIAVFDTTDPDANIVISDFTLQADRSSTYNIVIVEVAPSGSPSFAVTYTNNNPNNPVSTVNWHPRATVVTNSALVDPPSAMQYARSLGQQYARQNVGLVFDTFPWAISENLDLYSVIWDTEDEGLTQYNYLETQWRHVCQTGGATTHTVQRVVAS